MGYANPNVVSQFSFPGLMGSTSVLNDPSFSVNAGLSFPYAPMPGIPGMGQSGGFLGGISLDDAKLALAGIGTIGGLWSAWQNNKLAKEQFKYTKNVTDTNIANQIKSYNTSLEDRINSRAVMQGMSASDAAAYVEKNKMTRAAQ